VYSAANPRLSIFVIALEIAEVVLRLGLVGVPPNSMSSRTKRVVVRFSLEELVAVRARARALHLPLAEYLRDASLSRVPRAKRAEVYADLILALNQVGLALSVVPDEGGQVALRELRAVLRVASGRLRRTLPKSDVFRPATLE
jgi:hypothetical protein